MKKNIEGIKEEAIQFALEQRFQAAPGVSATPWDHRFSEVCPKGDGRAETECVVGTAMEENLSPGLYRVIGKTLSFTEMEMGSH